MIQIMQVPVRLTRFYVVSQEKISNVIGYKKFTSMLFLLGSVLTAGGFRRGGMKRKSGRRKRWSRSAQTLFASWAVIGQLGAIGLLVGEALEPQLAKAGITQISGTYDALSQDIAIGKSATASGDYSQASGYDATAVGTGAQASGTFATASGRFTRAKGACFNQSDDLG